MVLFFFLQKKATIAAFYLVNMTESLKIHPFTIKNKKTTKIKTALLKAIDKNTYKYICDTKDQRGN